MYRPESLSVRYVHKMSIQKYQLNVYQQQPPQKRNMKQHLIKSGTEVRLRSSLNQIYSTRIRPRKAKCHVYRLISCRTYHYLTLRQVIYFTRGRCNIYVVNSAETETLALLSDGCSGQNKNIMVRFWFFTVHCKLFKKLVYVFPVRRHSYLPYDQDFGLFESQKRKTQLKCTLIGIHLLRKPGKIRHILI
ncbi:hypothetical protein PR048_027711 [Dryococelus australis]|uniref:Uncharacterized protein n=1 Tax=Dryococelus australis TaxID=614101 RepID=A0ABQ9GH84_9NEOP|nr:hypothetical protein PR048_027711 [Dryococelus australis]